MIASLKLAALKKDTLTISGSKSETNRLLLLKALYNTITIENASTSDDSLVLKKALTTNSNVIDVHHAGTAMRFLTVYFACSENRKVTLTGSQRMQERPIGILVEALRSLGAQIEYINKEGYPPLLISGREITKSNVIIDASVSSQYISALALVGPILKNGLRISLESDVTSLPYLEMTLSLLQRIEINAIFNNNTIEIPSKKSVPKKTIIVESDWSSASYYYSIVALSQKASITLKSYKFNSIQGDSALSEIYKNLGVVTTFNQENTSITLTQIAHTLPKKLQIDLKETPDIAQTIAVTCLGLGVACRLTGLHTLKIKETDRLLALKTELEKLGASVTLTTSSIELTPRVLKSGVAIDTYQDHRMAMAFSTLATLTEIKINDAMVVTKSYPNYWEDLKKIGFSVSFER